MRNLSEIPGTAEYEAETQRRLDQVRDQRRQRAQDRKRRPRIEDYLAEDRDQTDFEE